jgi:hypothetical protein
MLRSINCENLQPNLIFKGVALMNQLVEIEGNQVTTNEHDELEQATRSLAGNIERLGAKVKGMAGDAKNLAKEASGDFKDAMVDVVHIIGDEVAPANIIRRQPLKAVGSAVLLGFAGALLFASSSKKHASPSPVRTPFFGSHDGVIKGAISQVVSNSVHQATTYAVMSALMVAAKALQSRGYDWPLKGGSDLRQNRPHVYH